MKNETIDEINKLIAWLDDNKRSNNIISIGKVLDNLSIQAEYFAELVTDAYSLMNELEDDYKIASAEFMKDFKGSVAKGEIEAEVLFQDKRREWTQAKNIYKKLNTMLDRIDKILESHRQSISVQVKTSVKNMTGI